jgi:tripartite-type tricarboxylate transporter receptor subunit TctC
MPFDAVKDFAPITIIASVPNLLVVHPDVPAKSVQELIALAKSKPGKLNFASFGHGTSNHLSGELLKSVAGIDVVHVPYKSAPQAVLEIVGGQVNFAFVNAPLALPQVKAGKLRALAVTGAQRSPAVPDLPTMKEAGLDFVVESWYGLMAPAGTPEPVIRKIFNDTVGVLKRPDMAEAFAARGADVQASASPEEFAKTVATEKARWAEVIAKSGAKID